MGKKLNFTKKEQKIISDSLTVISGVLMSKMDKGATQSNITGAIEVDNENIQVVFEFTARKTPIKG